MTYEEIVATYANNGADFISEPDAYRICAAFDIPFPEFRLVQAKADAIAAAEQIGYPVVIKIVSPQVIHKSDVGGVIVGLKNAEELDEGFDRLHQNVRNHAGNVDISGILVQKALSGGVEVVTGGLENAQFGPVVMFGTGGILIEVFKDVAFRLVPLDEDEARRQIEDTKAFEILKGVRGNPACDIDALSRLIVNTSRLLAEVGQITEIDFNPVRAYPDGCFVLDARLKL